MIVAVVAVPGVATGVAPKGVDGDVVAKIKYSVAPGTGVQSSFTWPGWLVAGPYLVVALGLVFWKRGRPGTRLACLGTMYEPAGFGVPRTAE